MGLVLFIFGIVAIIVGAAWFAMARRDESDGGALIGVLTSIVGVGLVVVSCVSTVSARSVGIQTSMGKYTNTLKPGVQLTAPWSSVEEWTTRNQVIRFAGKGDGEERDNYFTEPAITVRLGNQSEAYVDVTVTWRVTAEAVEGLWRQHKTFQDARQDFVSPVALGAANSAFDGYDPFAALNDKAADNPYVPLEEWSRKITEKLRPLYAARNVELITVQVTKVSYDQRTEGKLREYADAVANTRIKAQDVETAKNEARASAERAAGAGQKGNDCVSLIRDLAAQGKLQDLPAGWQCPGAAGVPVIVGGK